MTPFIFPGKIHKEIASPYKCFITPTNTTNTPSTNKNPRQPANDFIQTPENRNFLSKRSFSESIKTEKGKFFEEKSEDLVKIGSNDESSFQSNKNSSFFCKTHQEEFSLFCVTEKETLCPSCVYMVPDKHKTHNILPLTQASSIIRKDIEKFRGFAREKLLKVEDSIKISLKNITIIEKSLLDFTNEIEKEFGNIRKSLEIREFELKERIKQICFEKTNHFEAKIKDLTFLQECLKDYKNVHNNDECVEQNNLLYFYNVNNLLKKTLLNIDFNYKVLNNHEIEKLDFSNRKGVLKEIEGFGKVIQNKVEIPITKSYTKIYNNLSNSMREAEFSNKNNISIENADLGEEKLCERGFHKRSKTECLGEKFRK